MNRLVSRIAARIRAADHRLDARMRRRVRSEASMDDGFVLLETVISIALVGVVMAAFTTFFVNTVVNTSQQRATQAATQIADSAMETIRGLPVSDLATGHDAASVSTQFNSPLAVSATMQPWLASMTQATDPLAPTNAGRTAAIPTIAVSQPLGKVAYSVNYFLGTCVIPTGSVAGTLTNAPCGLGAASTGISYLRAVVAVTWLNSHCPSLGCSYITSTLVLAADSSDPTFNQTPGPPTLPVVTNPGPQTSTAGSPVTLQLAVNANTGVPPMTWAVTAGTLPAGLGMNAAGLLSGTPTTVAASTSITVTVTDGFIRTASATFTWTVTAAPPTAPLAVLVANGDTQATATWSAPASNNGAAVTGYTATATSASSGGATCTTTGARTCTLTGLTNGVVYSLTVTATNSGGIGPASVAVNVIPYPALLSGSNARLWLDGYDPATVFQNTAATTPTTTVGQPISYWKDKSGAGNNVTMPGTTATAPTADTADFPGMSATFTNGQYLSSNTGFPTNSDYSLFTVYEPTNLNCTGNLVSGGATNNNHAFYLNGSYGLNLFHGGTFTPLNGQGATADTSYIGSGTFVTSSGLGSVDVNGAPVLTGYTSSQTTDPAIQIGAFAGGYGFCGQIAEVIVLNRVVSVSERRAVEVYLARKWGIAVTPDPPAGLAALPANGSAVVSWMAPAYTGGAAITGYIATASNGQTCSPVPATATSCTITGLTNSTAYTVTVAASNSSGVGAQTAPVSVTPRPVVPGAPTAVTATSGNTTATVAWTAPTFNGGSTITSYTATASPGGRTCTTSGTTCVITGLTNQTAYTITVTATNVTGVGSASAAASVTPHLLVPGAPTAVAAAPGDTTVTVSWAAPVANGSSAITGYTVSSSPGSATCSTTTALSCTVTGLTDSLQYTFVVNATNAFGAGPTSAAATATPLPLVMLGTGMTLWLDGGDPTTTLSSSGCTGAAAASSATIGCWDDKSSQGENFAQGNSVNRPTVTAWGNGTSLNAVSFNDTSDVLNSINANDTYQTVFVVANVTGSGPASYLFGNRDLDTNVRIGSGVQRGAGDNINDWAYNNGAVPFNWTNSVLAAYTPTPARVITTDQSRTPFRFSASVSNTFLNRGVVGSIGEVITFGGVLPTSDRRAVEQYLSLKWGIAILPAAPTNPAATAANASAVVSWTAPAATGGGALTYTASTSTGKSCTTTNTSCTITGLTPGTNYSVTVTATNTVGTGPASTAVSVTPVGPIVTTPANQTSTTGAAVSLAVTTACANTPCTLTLTGAPLGLVIDSGAGTISGTITSGPRTFSPTVTSTDASGTPFSATFTWTVLAAPSVTAPANQADTTGAAVNVALATSCPNSPCSYALNGGPTGLAVSSAGIISGTVTSAAGSFTGVTVTVTDNSGVASTTGGFTWTVFAAPSVTAPANQTNTTGTPANVALTTTCPNTPCSYVLNGGPAGLTATATAISGTVGAAGSFTGVTVTVTDQSGIAVTSSIFTWTVYAAPTVTSPGNQSNSTGSVVSVTLTTSCGNGPCSYTLNNGPAGLSISAAGVISGTISSPPQTFAAVTVKVTDSVGVSTTSAAFNWAVTYPALVATNPGAQVSTVSRAITALQMTASGGSGTYVWSGGGTLPVGLTMTPGGRITGTPTAVSSPTVTVTVTDAPAGYTQNVTFSWAVKAQPTITAPGAQTTTIGAPANVQVTSTCANPTCSYALTSAPAGLNISSTGLITGAPTTTGTFNTVTVTITDAAGANATTANFTWTVYAAPTVTTPSAQSTALGAAANLSVGYTCLNTPCTFTLANAPSGLSINSSGVISGTVGSPAQVYNTVTVTVTDNAGVTATTANFSWTVRSNSVGTLANPVWSVSNSATGAAARSVTYAYSFTTATTANKLASVTMSVPAGTAGTPVATVSGFTAASTSTTLSGNVLTVSFSQVAVPAGTAVSISISGMTNTTTVGTYTSLLTTNGALNGGAIIALDSATAVPISFTAGTLANAVWQVSNSAAGAKPSTYTYRFSTATTATLSSVTMVVPPGTAGTAAAAVTGLPAGTVSLANGVLTYTLTTPTSVSAGTAVSLTVSGLTNTSVVDSYLSQLTTFTTTGGSSVPIDSAPIGPIAFTAGTLAGPTWSVSKTGAGATNVTYSYSFTTTTTGNLLTALKLTVPPGTGGTPVVTIPGLSGATISLSGTLLTVTASGGQFVPAGTSVTVTVTGLTNTTVVGTYTSQVLTVGQLNGGAIIELDSGITGPITIA